MSEPTTFHLDAINTTFEEPVCNESRSGEVQRVMMTCDGSGWHVTSVAPVPPLMTSVGFMVGPVLVLLVVFMLLDQWIWKRRERVVFAQMDAKQKSLD